MSIEKPDHYNTFKTILEDGTAMYEPTKVMKHLYLDYGYYMTCIIKYLPRAPHKGQLLSDYKKALYCIQMIAETCPVRRATDSRVYYLEAACEDWGLPDEIRNVIPQVWVGDYAPAIKSLSEYIEKITGEEDGR